MSCGTEQADTQVDAEKIVESKPIETFKPITEESKVSELEKEIVVPETKKIIEQVVEESISEEPIIEETIPTFVVNVSKVVKICNGLCKSSAKAYCSNKREVVFWENQITYGTCRSLAKYNKSFQKCESFCKSYGENKWPSSYCTLPDGSSDNNCDGK